MSETIFLAICLTGGSAPLAVVEPDLGWAAAEDGLADKPFHAPPIADDLVPRSTRGKRRRVKHDGVSRTNSTFPAVALLPRQVQVLRPENEAKVVALVFWAPEELHDPRQARAPPRPL